MGQMSEKKELRSQFCARSVTKEKEVRVIKGLGLDLPSKGGCIKAKSLTLVFLPSFCGIERP